MLQRVIFWGLYKGKFDGQFVDHLASLKIPLRDNFSHIGTILQTFLKDGL